MKPYRSMVFRVRERFDFFRPVISVRRVSDSGLDSAMIPSRARLRSDRTLVKLSVKVNHTFGSPAAGLYLPLAIAIVRAFICSKLNTVHLRTFLCYSVFGAEASRRRSSHARYRRGFNHARDGCLRQSPRTVAVGVS